MRVLIDTNVILDVLLNRQPWAVDLAAVWKAHDDGRIVGYLVASVLTDIFYVVRRHAGLPTAHAAVRICSEAFEICEVDHQALLDALALPGKHFEDSLQIACAGIAHLDAIVARNKQDFGAATI